MRVGGAGHGHRVAVVGQFVAGFVFNGRPGVFLPHVCVKAAALDYKAGHNAVENGAVIKAFIHIGQKIFYGFGRFFRVKGNFNISHIGFQLYHGRFLGLPAARFFSQGRSGQKNSGQN